MRILVAEDEFTIRLVLTEALRDAGFEVLEASNGEAALQLMEDPDHIAAVVTDFHMPGANGDAVAHRARHRHPDIPVVLITGRPDVLSDYEIEQPFVCLPKPFSVERMVSIVRQAVRRPD
jgi:DNA-binding NtrC family response regulator